MSAIRACNKRRYTPHAMVERHASNSNPRSVLGIMPCSVKIGARISSVANGCGGALHEPYQYKLQLQHQELFKEALAGAIHVLTWMEINTHVIIITILKLMRLFHILLWERSRHIVALFSLSCNC